MQENDLKIITGWEGPLMTCSVMHCGQSLTSVFFDIIPALGLETHTPTCLEHKTIPFFAASVLAECSLSTAFLVNSVWLSQVPENWADAVMAAIIKSYLINKISVLGEYCGYRGFLTSWFKTQQKNARLPFAWREGYAHTLEIWCGLDPIFMIWSNFEHIKISIEHPALIMPTCFVETLLVATVFVLS